MHREIKFRGRKKYGSKDWLYGQLSNVSGDWYVFPEEAWDSPDNYEVDPETVGQFTGAKDKNGVEIYEGDILNLGEIGADVQVFWKPEAMAFMIGETLDCVPLNWFSDKYTGGATTVTGNIHDTKTTPKN